MAFSNLILGPVVSLSKESQYNEVYTDLLEEGYIPISIIRDKKDPMFKTFLEHNPGNKPVAMFITIQYLKQYE